MKKLDNKVATGSSQLFQQIMAEQMSFFGFSTFTECKFNSTTGEFKLASLQNKESVQLAQTVHLI